MGFDIAYPQRDGNAKANRCGMGKSSDSRALFYYAFGRNHRQQNAAEGSEPQTTQNMRNRLLLLAILLLGGMNHLTAQNYDFSAQTDNYPYQTLYYRILYAENEYGETTNTYTVEVVNPNGRWGWDGDTWYGYTRPYGNIHIPEWIYNGGEYYTVVTIGPGAFQDCDSLTSVVIPNSVTSIGDYAFGGCSILASVSIPNSVTSIGSYSFSGCASLSSVIIPNSVDSIGVEAFSWCGSLTNVIIPDGVSIIGENAFLFIPSIVYHGTATGSPWGAMSMNGFIDGDFIYSDSTKTVLWYYMGDTTHVVIPPTVSIIGGKAFIENRNLTNIVIPNSVTSIGDSAFYGCYRLASVSIPNSVTSIGDYTFCDCDNLDSVFIPSSVTSIGNYAFAYCSRLVSVSIPNSVTSIGQYAFANTRITSLNIPNTVTTIGSNAFLNLRHLDYYGTATGSPWGALSMNGFVDGYFLFSDSTKTVLVLYLGDSTQATIPSTVTTIWKKAFANSYNLTGLFIPNSVTSIGDSAFYRCYRLASVFIPNSVTSIGNYAFYDCSHASLSIPSSVTSIGDYTFYNCDNLDSVFIPSSVTSIGNYAFAYCDRLASVSIPNSVTSIGDYTFFYCGNLDSVFIPSSVTSIGNYAFAYCDGLASVSIPNSVTSIGQYAFAYSGIELVSIPQSVSNIGSAAFSHCNNLETVFYNADSCTCHSIFYESSISYLYIGDSVHYIPDDCFYYAHIRYISMGESLTHIGQYAFYTYTSIDTIETKNTIPPSLHYMSFDYYNTVDNTTVIVPCVSISSYESNWGGMFRNYVIPEQCVAYDFWVVSPSDDTLYYRIIDSNVVSLIPPRGEITDGWDGFSPPEGLLIIPEIVEYEETLYSVECISSYAFTNNNNITTLFLPHTIKHIGYEAFSSCVNIDTLYFDIDSAYYISLNNVFVGDTGVKSVNIGNHVKRIPDYTFDDITFNLSSLSFGDSVSTIGSYAFYGLNKLDTLIIPNTIVSIGSSAFASETYYYLSDGSYIYNESRLSFLLIGESVDTIESNAFSLHSILDTIIVAHSNTKYDSRDGCNAIIETHSNNLIQGCNSTIIPNDIRGIGPGAFCNAKHLKTIVIPDSVTQILNFAFYGCDSLSSVTIGSSVTTLKDYSFGNCPNLRTITLPASLSNIAYGAFSSCYNLDTIISRNPIPPTISYTVFDNPSATIIVPCNSTPIYINSQWGNYFSSFEEPSDCTYSNYYDFSAVSPSNDTLYYIIKDSNNVIVVHPLEFNYNNENSYWKGYTQPMGSLIIPSSVIHNERYYNVSVIGNDAFKGNVQITSAEIPSSCDSIKQGAFAQCTNLDTLIYNAERCLFWEGRHSYNGSSVFMGDTINTLIIGSGVKWLPQSCFDEPGFDFVQTLYYNADSIVDCNNICNNLPITTLNIGSNVKTIPYRAFYGCSGLTSITIPDSIKRIGAGAFSGCSGLTTVYYNAVNSDCWGSIFATDSVIEYDSLVCYDWYDDFDELQQECVTEWFSDVILTTPHITSLIIGPKVKKIPNYIFSNLTDLSNLTIPPSVTDIGEESFINCSGLNTINLPDSTIHVGPYAFSNCSSLSSINMPDSVEFLGDGAFAGCSSLASVILPSHLDTIRYQLFARCSALDSVIIPNTTRAIGSNAFAGCNNMSSIVIPNSVKRLESNAFDSCINLSSITIPNSIIHIGQSAFKKCSSLTSIIIPDSVMSIGIAAFEGCSGITTITIGSGVTSIGENAFKDCSGLTTVYYNAQSCSTITVRNQYSDDHSLFSNCNNFSTLHIGENVRIIPSYGFKDCNHISSITIPNSVNLIGSDAFSGCTMLTNLIIGSNVSSLGARAFMGCTYLDTIILHPHTPPAFVIYRYINFQRYDSYGTFYQIPHGNITVLVPCNRLSVYNSSNWHNLFNLSESDCSHPDLIVSQIDISDSITSCSQTNLTATITNIGSYRTRSIGWYDRLYISHSPVFNSSAIKLDSVYHNDVLMPDSSYTVSFASRIPQMWTGETYFYVTTGVGMDRNEINENNNTSRSDSVNIQLPAILHPGITTIDTACNQYQWHDRNYYYSGTYTYQHEYDDSPCYSYDTLRLKIWPRVYSYQRITIPDTSSYVFFGQEYNQTGTYTGTAQSSHGCDSIVTLYLRVLPIRMPIQQAAVCQGQPYSNGIFYLSGDATAEATGTIHLRDTVRTLDGYDSIISGVDVTVYPSTIAAVHSFVPADDSIITRGDLTLHWNSVAGAVGYRVYLWEAGLEAPQTPTYTTTSTHWRITEFGDCRTYQWRVDAFNACTVASGSVHQFGICTPASMTVSSHTVMFDNTGYNTPSVQRLAIVGHNLHDSIRLTLHGEDSSMFSLPTSRIGKNGANIPITFTPSVLKQNFSAYLTVDCGEMHDTVALQGRMKNLYVFTLSVPDSVLPPGSAVPISGMCENVAGEAQAGVAVDVHINVLGNTTVLTDTTDGAGHFQVTYTPRMSECGYYRVGASLHGQTPTGVLAEFNIPGISLVAPNSTWVIGLNDTVTGYIPVKNRSNITLHNVSIAADSLPAGLNLQFNAITLAPLSTGRIPYTLTCSRLTTGHEYENAYFEATCTEGNLGRVSVRYYCYKPMPDLQISYDTIVCTAVPGSQKTVDIALYNNTDSTFNNVLVQTPTGFSGMSLLLGDSAYAILPHDSLFIPLLVTLPEGTPLTPITGDILVTAENTQSQNVPFEIDVVSSAIGSLQVLVSNEYTYAYGTFVDSATVSVTGYYSLDTVAYAVTDSTGMIVLDSLPEGYYRVHVSAPKNNSYDNVVMIAGGHEKFLDVHLEYQAISYSWEVSQTSVDDEWSIHLNTTFETNVPKPVVTLDIPYFNVNFDGSFSTFNIIVSNQGLIDCYDATLIVPESEYYEFVPLFDKIDTLKALTSIPVPCAVRSKAIYDSIVRIEQDCNCTADTIYDTTVWHDVVTQYRDTVIYTVDTIWTDSITYDTIPRYDTLIIPVVKYQDRIDSVITKIVWVDSFYYETVVVYDTVLTLSHESIPQYGNCEDHPFRLMARWECSAGGKPVYAGTVTRKMDCPSTSKDEANSSLSRLRDLLDDWLGGGGGGYDWPGGGGRGPNGGGGGGNSPRHAQQPIPDNDNEWECMPCWAKSLANIMDCGLSIGGGMAGSTAGRAAASTFGYLGAYEALVNNNDPGEAELRAMATSLGLIPHPFTKATSMGITCLYDAMDAVNYCINNGYEEEIPWGYKDLYKLGIEINVDTNIIIVNLKQPKIYYDTIWGPPIRTIFYDTTITIDPEIKRSIIRHMIVNNDTTIQQLKESYDTTIVDIDTTILRRCLIVWKRTVEYMQRGWIDPSLVPNGFSIDYIYYDSSTIRKLMEIEQIAQAQGYQSVAEMFYETARTLLLSPKKSVCAGVALQFSQDVAMTREAFEGVLTLNNPHESNPIRNLTLNFTVSDSAGHDCSDKFDIQIVHRQNIDTTGTLAPKSKGSITVRFVPLMSAAPSHPLPYLFGGSIGYTDPSTSAEMTDELRPVRLTVHPSPHLQLDYFVTHDIIADDPFTAPKIEPSVPATIGLRVRNDGIGAARNVRISSLSPQIVENRQGLVVDFSLFGTLMDGSLTNQPLNDIALGTVLPGEIHTMEYLIKSYLLGIINIKDVDVIHNSSIDDKDMSLVSARAHKLMKTILEYSVGADAIHDFLTNNSGSPYPDSIYFSSGKTLKVHHINDATYDHNVNYIDTIYHDDGTFDTLHITDTIVQVTITPDSVGWQYASTLDPGEGKYEIVSCIRDDSTVIPLDNIWLTFVDLESGNDPNYINRMHIVDTISAVRTTSYNVTFRLKKDMLEVSSINDIPRIELFGNLDSFCVVFNKPIIDSSFSYRDMSLKCNNGVQLMDSTIRINRINDTTFNVNVSNRTAAFGLYVLKVSADSIMDTLGQYGFGGMEARWIQATCTTYYDTVTMESCDSLMWHDTVLYTSCIYQDTLPQLIGGCDSITTLRLTIHNSNNTIETISACDNYTWHGNTYISSTTTPTFSTTNSHGCDSTISLHLTINYSTSGSESVTACDSYTWHDSTYTTSTYTPTFITTNANGCDSTIHLHLIVNYSDSTQMAADVCFGDSLLFNNRWVFAQGLYVDTLQTRQGCDSIVMLSLTVNPVSTTLLADTACDSYFWQDSVYTASATASFLTTNRYGCDSTVTLNLVINYSTHDTIVDTAAGSYTWQGHTYTESGEYRFEGQTSEGCDSVIVLQLTVTEVGINSADSAADITLFPNPTKGMVTILSEGVVKVEVYDQAGRRVAEIVGGNEVDLGHLPSGIYTLHITLQHSATVRRIVKQ